MIVSRYNAINSINNLAKMIMIVSNKNYRIVKITWKSHICTHTVMSEFQSLGRILHIAITRVIDVIPIL